MHKANTFRAYFGDRAGPDLGYWSTEYGAWHIAVLNSNCTVVVGGCAKDSPQQKWLDADLAAHPDQCTVVLMHHPRWSTGIAGPDGRLADLFDTMVAHRADVLLSGHEADYERFPLLNGDGATDPRAPGSSSWAPAARSCTTRARRCALAEQRPSRGQRVLRVRPARGAGAKMNPDSYTWAFHALDGKILDSGTTACHHGGA